MLKIFTTFFFVCLMTTLALACRFNVRDLGFVDLEDQPYRLLFYVDTHTDKSVINNFRTLAETELRESNIKTTIIDIDHSPKQEDLSYLTTDIASLPVVIFLSPEKQTMRFQLPAEPKNIKPALQNIIGTIIDSPIRNEIIKQTINAFGAVLIIESSSVKQNNEAIEIANAAVKQIANQMSFLPKAIGKPPVVIKLSRDQQKQEGVFLWSMGIDQDDIKSPLALVFYGRGRRIASVLKGSDLTKGNLQRFLYVIGSDCECNLDRSWMKGAMIPATLNHQQLKELTEQLGFDPENPMIKMEISRIILGRALSGNNHTLQATGNFGYHELDLENIHSELPSDNSDDTCDIEFYSRPLSENPDEAGTHSQAIDKKPSRPYNEAIKHKRWNPLWLIGGGASIVLLISAYLAIGKFKEGK